MHLSVSYRQRPLPAAVGPARVTRGRGKSFTNCPVNAQYLELHSSLAFHFESVTFADQGIPQSSPEKFLGVDGNQHRNPLLTDMRTWEISALNGMSISYSSPQGSGMWKRSRKIVRTRGGAPERQHFPNTTGKMQYELTEITEYARDLQKLKLSKAPGQRRGSGQKTP